MFYSFFSNYHWEKPLEQLIVETPQVIKNAFDYERNDK
jgi:hypothetical protein